MATKFLSLKDVSLAINSEEKTGKNGKPYLNRYYFITARFRSEEGEWKDKKSLSTEDLMALQSLIQQALAEATTMRITEGESSAATESKPAQKSQKADWEQDDIPF